MRHLWQSGCLNRLWLDGRLGWWLRKSAPLNHVEFPMFEALLADWNLVFLSFILLANFHGIWDTVDLHRAQIVSVPPGESISEERICLFFGIFRIFEHLLLFSFISLTLFGNSTSLYEIVHIHGNTLKPLLSQLWFHGFWASLEKKSHSC